ncbi:hypothetical protein [Natronosalvus caseinilyticus]|uniref:hypothetical protein n=1 Tax=Natronosalvus caseinilyticus TaxID=2953747 RepID=UPI0028A95FA6|nr:hypothetical protein [Natronosalvus caseinilyticus]
MRGTGDAELRLIGDDRTRTVSAHTDWHNTSLIVSDFAGQEVTVQLRAENDEELEVDYVSFLEDTADTGIPDEVQTMPLRMRHGSPGVFWSPLDLDPAVADTSGDGLTDAEVIDLEWDFVRSDRGDGAWDLKAVVNGATAHPARIDTTGDGLTDRQQLEGWEINVVDEHGEAKAMMEALADPDDDRDLGQFFTERPVKANPLIDDTDGDGLSDAEEFELGTDPELRDTTGDGISDRDALELDREDPTMFTVTPPAVSLSSINEGINNEKFELPKYWVTYGYELSDSAGVASAELRRDCARFDKNTYPGKKSEFDTSTFESTLEIALTPWRGSLTTITVEDVHENIGTETLYYKHPYAVKLATELNSPEEAGVLTGVTMGAAELPDFIRLVRKEPREMATAMTEFIEEMGRASVDPMRNPWVEIAKDLPPSIYHDQQQANPYPAPSSDPLESFSTCLGTLGYSDGDHLGLSDEEFTHCQFANGWYSGYSAFLVIETLVGDKGFSKGATSASDVATQLRRASDDLESVLPAVRSGQSMRTTQVSHRLLTDGGRQLDDLSPQFRTAGKTVQGVKRLEASCSNLYL